MRSAVGAYGKMPSQGDFFRIDLPRSFVQPWDAWLQHFLSVTRSTLSDTWDALYMSAPIWRFSIASPHIGAARVSGVLMPSVDRVGRRFPLTLAACHTGGTSAADHFAYAPTFEALEQIALDALDDAMTLNTLKDRLRAVRFDPVAQDATSTQAPLNSGTWTARLEAGERMMVCDGLPDDVQMRGLIDLNAAIWADDHSERSA